MKLLLFLIGLLQCLHAFKEVAPRRQLLRFAPPPKCGPKLDPFCRFRYRRTCRSIFVRVRKCHFKNKPGICYGYRYKYLTRCFVRKLYCKRFHPKKFCRRYYRNVRKCKRVGTRRHRVRIRVCTKTQIKNCRRCRKYRTWVRVCKNVRARKRRVRRCYTRKCRRCYRRLRKRIHIRTLCRYHYVYRKYCHCLKKCFTKCRRHRYKVCRRGKCHIKTKIYCHRRCRCYRKRICRKRRIRVRRCRKIFKHIYYKYCRHFHCRKCVYVWLRRRRYCYRYKKCFRPTRRCYKVGHIYYVKCRRRRVVVRRVRRCRFYHRCHVRRCYRVVRRCRSYRRCWRKCYRIAFWRRCRRVCARRYHCYNARIGRYCRRCFRYRRCFLQAIFGHRRYCRRHRRPKYRCRYYPRRCLYLRRCVIRRLRRVCRRKVRFIRRCRRYRCRRCKVYSWRYRLRHYPIIRCKWYKKLYRVLCRRKCFLFHKRKYCMRYRARYRYKRPCRKWVCRYVKRKRKVCYRRIVGRICRCVCGRKCHIFARKLCEKGCKRVKGRRYCKRVYKCRRVRVCKRVGTRVFCKYLPRKCRCVNIRRRCFRKCRRHRKKRCVIYKFPKRKKKRVRVYRYKVKCIKCRSYRRRRHCFYRLRRLYRCVRFRKGRKKLHRICRVVRGSCRIRPFCRRFCVRRRRCYRGRCFYVTSCKRCRGRRCKMCRYKLYLCRKRCLRKIVIVHRLCAWRLHRYRVCLFLKHCRHRRCFRVKAGFRYVVRNVGFVYKKKPCLKYKCVRVKRCWKKFCLKRCVKRVRRKVCFRRCIKVRVRRRCVRRRRCYRGRCKYIPHCKTVVVCVRRASKKCIHYLKCLKYKPYRCRCFNKCLKYRRYRSTCLRRVMIARKICRWYQTYLCRRFCHFRPAAKSGSLGQAVLKRHVEVNGGMMSMSKNLVYFFALLITMLTLMICVSTVCLAYHYCKSLSRKQFYSKVGGFETSSTESATDDSLVDQNAAH